MIAEKSYINFAGDEVSNKLQFIMNPQMTSIIYGSSSCKADFF